MAGTARAATNGRRSDLEVVRASQQDPEAFGALFDCYAAPVHAFLSRRSNAERADELLGEVFVVAFRRRADADPADGSLLPWLLGIAVRLLLAEGRAETRRAALLARVAGRLDPVAHPWPDVDARVDAEALRSALREGLAGLPEDERDVLLLVAWEQLTPTQAALVLGIPAGTARSRLHRARHRLRRALDPVGLPMTDQPEES